MYPVSSNRVSPQQRVPGLQRRRLSIRRSNTQSRSLIAAPSIQSSKRISVFVRCHVSRKEPPPESFPSKRFRSALIKQVGGTTSTPIGALGCTLWTQRRTQQYLPN